MKICYLLPTLGIGGAERIVTQLASGVSADNHVDAVNLVCIFETKSEIRFDDKNFSVIRLSTTIRKKIKAVFSVNKFLFSSRPSVVHTHLSSIIYSLPYILIGKIFGLSKFFHTIHNEFEKDAPGILRYIYNICFKLKLVTPIFLSNSIADKEKCRFKKIKYFIIPNGVEEIKATEKIYSVKSELDKYKMIWVLEVFFALPEYILKKI